MMLTLLAACSPQEQVVQETDEEPVVPEEQNAPNPTETGEEVMPAEHTVTITAAGFEPKTLTVKAGDTVTFVNENSNQHWPASAMHPTHTVYPGSDIQKCGTSEEEDTFDACRGLAQGESFSFIFNEIGTWRYHDHLQTSSTGTIIVE